MNYNRVNKLNKYDQKSGTIVYWMSRDQRANDNWSLIFAQKLADKYESELLVCFNLLENFLGATRRHFGFMLRSLEQVKIDIEKKNIPFHILYGDAVKNIIDFVNSNNAKALISDFDPLRIKQNWQKNILKEIEIPFYEVDTHNIVPCRIASDKQEYGARTIRKKIQSKLEEYLEEFPEVKKHNNSKEFFNRYSNELKYDLEKYHKEPAEVDWLKPGEKEALKNLNDFIETKLDQYLENRNDPYLHGLSDMSPYIHFGQISAQRIALEVQNSGKNQESVEAYLEELIIRRELSDNFCLYNENYDKFEGFPAWAQTTLNVHREDKREYLYSLEQLEKYQTHDQYWNAAQKEMVDYGKMHGYMRMYWGKKILEWTENPETALDYAIYLNDKYELDGRDPNGYVGIAWSIGGVHDRGWTEREIFGKIRFMNDKGLKRKFNIDEYVNQIFKSKKSLFNG